MDGAQKSMAKAKNGLNSAQDDRICLTNQRLRTPVPGLCVLVINGEPMRAWTPAREPVWGLAIPSGHSLILR